MFAKTIKRPFGVRYNPYTQSVETLSNTRKIMDLVSELKGDLCVVTNALAKIRDDNDASHTARQEGDILRSDYNASSESTMDNNETTLENILHAFQDLNIPTN